MMLVSAKYRDFCQKNPHQEQPDFELDYQPKSSASKHKVCDVKVEIFNK